MSQDLYRRAIAEWGVEAQFRQLQEECAELIVQINKLWRGKGSDNAIAEEMADVEIMLEQARLMVAGPVDEFKRIKLAKLKGMLDGLAWGRRQLVEKGGGPHDHAS